MGSISQKLRFEILARDCFTCRYCGAMAPDVLLEVDHINPRKGDGGNHPDNLATSCHRCNRGKGSVPLCEYQQGVDWDLLDRQQTDMLWYVFKWFEREYRLWTPHPGWDIMRRNVCILPQDEFRRLYWAIRRRDG